MLSVGFEELLKFMNRCCMCQLLFKYHLSLLVLRKILLWKGALWAYVNGYKVDFNVVYNRLITHSNSVGGLWIESYPQFLLNVVNS